MWRELPLETIVESIPVAVMVAARDGRIDYANARARLLLGAQKGSLAGRELGTLRVRPRFAPPTAPNAGEWQDLSSWRTLSGGRVYALETVVALCDENGEPRYFVHFLQQLSAALAPA